MADFWVTQQRHWCKYCKKFIANNKPSIQIHESGRSHKAQVEKFLRDVYKRGKEEKEEKANLQRELQRIERAAMKTYGSKDVPGYRPSAVVAAASSSGTASTAYPSSSASQQPYYYSTPSPAQSATSSPYTPPPPSSSSTPEDQLSQQQPPMPAYTLQGRDEWALPAPVGAPGEWETITPVAKPQKPTEDKAEGQNKKITTHDDKPEFQDDEEDNEEDLKSFKIREKEYPADTYGNDNDDDSNEPKDDAGGSLFKKRKISQQNSSRKKKPLRKKEE